MRPLGKHLILDAWECNGQINSVEAVEAALREAVIKTRVTLIELVVHPFTPHGVSGVAVIAESHLAVHTWPEEGYFSLDIFTCGDQSLPEAAIAVFKDRFEPHYTQVVELPRGCWMAGVPGSAAQEEPEAHDLSYSTAP